MCIKTLYNKMVRYRRFYSTEVVENVLFVKTINVLNVFAEAKGGLTKERKATVTLVDLFPTWHCKTRH